MNDSQGIKIHVGQQAVILSGKHAGKVGVIQSFVDGEVCVAMADAVSAIISPLQVTVTPRPQPPAVDFGSRGSPSLDHL